MKILMEKKLGTLNCHFLFDNCRTRDIVIQFINWNGKSCTAYPCFWVFYTLHHQVVCYIWIWLRATAVGS